MTLLADKKLIYVTGKGGVGRSTVSAALAMVAAERGLRTIVCEVSEQSRIARLFGRQDLDTEEAALGEGDGLWGLSIDPQRALREWLATQLGSKTLVKLLFENDMFQYFAAAAPGTREMATIVKVWEVAQPQRWNRKATTYDLVIVDAPASGHGLGMLKTPRTFSQLARVGPIKKQADQVQAMLTNRKHTGYMAVALPQEMPVNETIDLEKGLADAVGAKLDAIVVNGVFPKRFTKADADRLGEKSRNGADVGLRAAMRAARAEAGWARTQQGQLTRLRRAADAEVFTLPFLFQSELGLEEVGELSRELSKKLA